MTNLAGFVRTTLGGNAPATSAALNGGVMLDNAGATLTTILLNNGAFVLTTSDDSLTDPGTYDYTKLSGNAGQCILNYTGVNVGSTLTGGHTRTRPSTMVKGWRFTLVRSPDAALGDGAGAARLSAAPAKARPWVFRPAPRALSPPGRRR